MAMITDDISINTLIGADSTITGDISVSGFVRVDGDIDGSLETTSRVIIGEKARIRGNVKAQSAIIGGIVEGDVFAPEKVQLFASAAVIGDIVTKHIQLAEGVLFHGYCVALQKEDDFESAVQKWQDERAVKERLFDSEAFRS